MCVLMCTSVPRSLDTRNTTLLLSGIKEINQCYIGGTLALGAGGKGQRSGGLDRTPAISLTSFLRDLGPVA